MRKFVRKEMAAYAMILFICMQKVLHREKAWSQPKKYLTIIQIIDAVFLIGLCSILLYYILYSQILKHLSMTISPAAAYYICNGACGKISSV